MMGAGRRMKCVCIMVLRGAPECTLFPGARLLRCGAELGVGARSWGTTLACGGCVVVWGWGGSAGRAALRGEKPLGCVVCARRDDDAAAGFHCDGRLVVKGVEVAMGQARPRPAG